MEEGERHGKRRAYLVDSRADRALRMSWCMSERAMAENEKICSLSDGLRFRPHLLSSKWPGPYYRATLV